MWVNADNSEAKNPNRVSLNTHRRRWFCHQARAVKYAGSVKKYAYLRQYLVFFKYGKKR